MSNDQLTIMDLLDYYNGYNSIAERVSPHTLRRLHIATDLEKYIQSAIVQGNDIILTGNPGDGKTHLITQLIEDGTIKSEYVEKDASQKISGEIYDQWREQRRKHQPFLLAINHAPLRRLVNEIRSVNDHGIDFINILVQIDKMTYYNEEQSELTDTYLVIDLDQREILNKPIVSNLITKICSDLSKQSCQYCPPKRCPVDYNIHMLQKPSTIDALVTIFMLVSQRGFHATMRDLIGLIAYVITGGTTCEYRWQSDQPEQPTFEDFVYYNLLYKGRNRLFEQIRRVFDPGRYADPHLDIALWRGDISENWLGDKPMQPSSIHELRHLKRRFFFEQEHDHHVYFGRVLSSVEDEFRTLMIGNGDDRAFVQKIVAMINMFYAPNNKDSDYEYRLRLWNNHRYSVGTIPGYFAMRSISCDKLDIYRPTVATHLKNYLDIHQNHILLGVQNWQRGDPALKVDWTLFQALSSARSGMPIDVQPFHIQRRLDLFLRSLGVDAGGSRPIETIEWSDHRRRTIKSVRVNRETRLYETERG